MVEQLNHQASKSQDFATDVEKQLLSGNTQGAVDTFRQQYIDTLTKMSPADARTVLSDERAKLKAMDSNGYDLLMIESAKSNPLIAGGEHISKKDLTLMGRLPENATAQEKFHAEIAKELLPQYDKLVGGVEHNFWNKMNPINWQSGFTATDLNRASGDLELDERKKGMAAISGDVFLKNNGELLDKIAGISGVIDRDTLQLALDKDKTKPMFSEDQRNSVQWMADNWDDPAVNQLKDGKATWSDYGRVLPSLTFEGTRAAAEIGWQDGNKWGGTLGGAIEGTAAGVLGFFTGAGPLGANGSLTKDSLESANRSNFDGKVDAYSMLGDSSSLPRSATTRDALRAVHKGYSDAGDVDPYSGRELYNFDSEQLKSALTVGKGESYSSSAERLLQLAGRDASGKEIKRVAHELWVADGRRPANQLRVGHILKMNDQILNDPLLESLRDAQSLEGLLTHCAIVFKACRSTINMSPGEVVSLCDAGN